MQKQRAIVLAAASLLLSLSAAGSRAADLAIEHARIYTAPHAAPIADGTVLIHDGRITAVSSKRVALPPGTTVLACKGCVVMAGFWNAHVHFMGPQWLNAEKQPPEQLKRELQDMLTHSGFTSVVDTGSDLEGTNAVRSRIERGDVPGPRIRTAGLPLYPEHALPYYLADLPPELKAKLGQPESPEAARAFVGKNLAGGADITKLFTGSIVGPDQVTPMREDIATAAVAESHRRGVLVFTHPTNLEGVRVALASGVDVLAHAPEVVHDIGPAVLRDMAGKHMTIIPTLQLLSQDRNIADIRRVVLDAHRAGVRLVFGTDTGFLTDYNVSEEFRQLALTGLDTDEILAMLTTAPAELFKVSEHQGRVAVGMDGDLTILGSDPQKDGVSAFSNVRYAIRGGKVLFDGAEAAR